MPKDDGIGAATVRREDVRFLTGRGRYSDDIKAYGECAAVFARSNVANGTIKSINTDVAASHARCACDFYWRRFCRGRR